MLFLFLGLCQILFALEVPDSHVALNSTDGLQYFKTSVVDMGLLQNAVNQQHYATCSLASMAAVLNALEISPPQSSSYPIKWGFYPHFDEANIYNDSCVYGHNQRVYAAGSILDELAEMTSCFTPATTAHADKSDVAGFRAAVKECLSDGSKKIMINYARSSVGQAGGGHISPVIGFHEENDLILVADTSNYKYPMWWLSVSEMYDAMNTQDSDAVPGNDFRGWVVAHNPNFDGTDIMTQKVCESAEDEKNATILVVASILCPIFLVSTIVMCVLYFASANKGDDRGKGDVEVPSKRQPGVQ